MKYYYIFFCLLLTISSGSFTALKAQVNVNDSLALVDLYNNTNGPQWLHKTNWLTTMPVSTWTGIYVMDNRVAEIVLNDNNLIGTLSGTIGNLTSLTFLQLGHNQISGSIPSSIGKLVNLESMYIWSNLLSGSIPATIGSLKKLQALSLFDNQLSGSIPAVITSLTKLKVLVLHDNQLTGSIPADIGKLVKLQYLELDNNQLAGAIPFSLGKLSNLQYLYLNNNRLSGDIKLSFAKNYKHITAIQLQNNHLFISNNVDFPMAEVQKLSLNITYNNFTFNGLELIGQKISLAFYAPQAIIPLHQHGNALSVNAGGTLGNNTYNWFMVGATGSNTIKGDSTFMPTQGGKYYVTVTNSKAKQLTLYSDTIDFIMPPPALNKTVAGSNIQSNTVNSHLSVYPNPAQNVIQVQVNGTAVITITNTNGKILLTKNITNSGTINISAFAPGIYYVQNRLTGEVKKVVVIH